MAHGRPPVIPRDSDSEAIAAELFQTHSDVEMASFLKCGERTAAKHRARLAPETVKPKKAQPASLTQSADR